MFSGLKIGLPPPTTPTVPVSSVQVSRRQAILTAVLALGLFVVCAVALAVWMSADLFTLPNSKRGETFAGFSALHTTALAIYFLTAPWLMGFTYLAAITVFSHVSPLSSKRSVALVWSFLGLALAFFGLAMWAHEVVDCGVFWCLNPDTHQFPQDQYSIGDAFRSLNGMMMVAVGLAFSFAMLRVAFSETFDGCGKSLKCCFRDSSKTDWIIAVICMGILGCMFIGTMYLPNNLATSFTAPDMAQYASQPAQCSVAGATNCPELMGSFFTTSSYQINSYTYWNLFPANLIFYLYLALMLVTGVFINASSNFRGFLQRRRFYVCGRRLYFTIAGTCGWVLTLGMLVLFALYWIHDHRYNGSGDTSSSTSYSMTNRAARGFGQLAVAFMSLQLFPVARTSVVHRILGTTPEAFLFAHRVLGYFTLICILAHIFLWWAVFRENNLDIPFFEIPTKVPMKWVNGAVSIGPYAIEYDNYTIGLQMTLCLIVIPAMGLLTLAPIRRRAWELFKYSHVLAAYAIIPATLYHATAGWEYLLPGLTVYLIDRFMRLSRSGRHVSRASATAVGADVTLIEFEGGIVTHRAGQYVYINIPALSLLEWHPFTISSDPEKQIRTLHIKSMGEGTFTGRLRELVDAGPVSIEMYVDGPCGATNLHLKNDYDTVVLVAGGIGITPCASIANDMMRAGPMLGEEGSLNRSRVTLIWVARDARALGESLQLPIASAPDYSSAYSTLTVHAFDTTQAIGSTPTPWHFARTSGWNFTPGRPDWDSLMRSVIPAASRRPLVFCCGPEGMCRDAIRGAQHANSSVMVHEETFEL